MPCNLYGPGDNFNPEASHVIPGMIMKIHDAIQKESPSVQLLGTGNPLREFLYIEDLADAVVFLLENYNNEYELINVGSGKEISIRDLATIIGNTLGYKGEILFNTTGPDGTPRKIMDNSRINSLGWFPKTSLESGISETVKWFYENIEKIRK
jgi:GDP-L-fucose synthase